MSYSGYRQVEIAHLGRYNDGFVLTRSGFQLAPAWLLVNYFFFHKLSMHSQCTKIIFVWTCKDCMLSAIYFEFQKRSLCNWIYIYRRSHILAYKSVNLFLGLLKFVLQTRNLYGILLLALKFITVAGNFFPVFPWLSAIFFFQEFLFRLAFTLWC